MLKDFGDWKTRESPLLLLLQLSSFPKGFEVLSVEKAKKLKEINPSDIKNSPFPNYDGQLCKITRNLSESDEREITEYGKMFKSFASYTEYVSPYYEIVSILLLRSFSTLSQLISLITISMKGRTKGRTNTLAPG